MSRQSGIGTFSSHRRIASDMSRMRTTPSTRPTSANSGTAAYWDTVMGTSPSNDHSGSPAKRPFKCSKGCDQLFTQSSHLNQHIRAVHDRLKPFHCTLCNRSFGKKYDLTSHRSAVHLKVKGHTCQECRKPFAKRSNLVRHYAKVHNMLCPE